MKNPDHPDQPPIPGLLPKRPRGRPPKSYRKYKIRTPIRTAVPSVRKLCELIDSHPVAASRLEEMAGIASATITHWRSGRYAPNVATMDAILHVMGYQMEFTPIHDEGDEK